MSTKHTSGPWFADNAGRIWRRPPADLYENGGGVAGDKPLATVDKGWYRENEQGYPVEANARLIAAAPELLEALQAIHDSAPVCWWNLPYEQQQRIKAAIAKATGSEA